MHIDVSEKLASRDQLVLDHRVISVNADCIIVFQQVWRSFVLEKELFELDRDRVVT